MVRESRNIWVDSVGNIHKTFRKINLNIGNKKYYKNIGRLKKKKLGEKKKLISIL